MDNSFISRNNIDNIYDNINAYFVKNHNYNLDNFSRFKKIVKKISRTIFNSINNNDNYKDMVINEFNELVLVQSKEFLIKEMNNRPIDSNNIQPMNSNLIENKKIRKKKNKTKKKKPSLETIHEEPEHSKYELDTSFLQSFDNFNDHVIQANKKIKDNFNEIISQNKQNFSNQFVDRSLEVPDNKIMFERKLEENLSESTESLFDDYTNTNVKEILDSVVLNQKDHSNGNEFDGVTVGNQLLIDDGNSNIGIYQNSSKRTERINKKIVTIDSGTGNLNTVTNLGVNNWFKFRVDLQDTLIIDSLCNVYLKSFTIIGATSMANATYFVIDIDEFNISNFSNNTNMRNKITIANTLAAAGNFTVNYGESGPFVTTINPSNLNDLTITLTNQDNANVDGGVNNTFAVQVPNPNINRVIFELVFKTREQIDESIHEKSIYDK